VIGKVERGNQRSEKPNTQVASRCKEFRCSFPKLVLSYARRWRGGEGSCHINEPRTLVGVEIHRYQPNMQWLEVWPHYNSQVCTQVTCSAAYRGQQPEFGLNQGEGHSRTQRQAWKLTK